jgi:hypothetical protein
MKVVVVSLILNMMALFGGLLLLFEPFYLPVLWVLLLTLSAVAVAAGLVKRYLDNALLIEIIAGAALAVLPFFVFLGVLDWVVGSNEAESLSVRSLIRFTYYSAARSEIYLPFLLLELAVTGASALGFSVQRKFSKPKYDS